jgi:exosortase/archaeosortase family protein
VSASTSGRSGHRDLARTVTALVAGAVVVATIIFKVRDIARTEAVVSSWLIRFTGLADSRTVGTAVIYQLGHRWVGFAITGGCSVALLMIPPFILTSVLISLQRVSWVRGVVAVVGSVVLLAFVNQVRLFIIASAMQWWGFKTGYERSHVLIGSGITTIGIALVTIIFLIAITRQPGRRAPRNPGAPEGPRRPEIRPGGARHAA